MKKLEGKVAGLSFKTTLKGLVIGRIKDRNKGNKLEGAQS
jgi:hypothetical protein